MPLDIPIGTMIELPRAALTAGRIAEEADFFSFGTNDLTQTTWGFSRDDVEAAFFPQYMDAGIFACQPVRVHRPRRRRQTGAHRASARARTVKPGIDARCLRRARRRPRLASTSSVDVGLDYVSCSPFRVPVARLEAGRAAIMRGNKRRERLPLRTA